MSASTSEQDRIETDLARTRSSLDSRLSALKERLSPGQILDDLMGYARSSEGGDVARSLMGSIRSNPLPAALTGIGLAWLMASNTRPQPDSGSVDTAGTTAGSGKSRVYPGPSGGNGRSNEQLGWPVHDAGHGVVRQIDETEEAYRARLDDARGKSLGVVHQPEETADSFGQRVQDALAAAKQGVTQGVSGLRDQAGDAASSFTGSAKGAGEQLASGGQAARQMGSNLIGTLTDNPVLLGAVGLAVGALLGALVPQSDQEEAALGGLAHQARDAARNLTQDVVDRGGQIAQQSLDAGRDSARAHGLTGDKSVRDLVNETKGGDLASSVKQVAQDVLQAGDEAVRKHGLGRHPEDGISSGSADATPSPGQKA